MRKEKAVVNLLSMTYLCNKSMETFASNASANHAVLRFSKISAQFCLFLHL